MCQHCGGTCFLVFSAFVAFAVRVALSIRDVIMRNAKKVRKLTVWVLVVLAGLTGFSSASSEAEERIKVTVTILPLAEFTEKVGADRVEVSVMIPGGGNPHTYEPTPGQMRAASEAELYVKVGTQIEFETVWMDRLKALNRKMVVCDASEGIKLIGMEEHSHDGEHVSGCGHGGEDPHIWLSPLNAIIMTANIRDALTEIDPAHGEYYAANARKYIIELNRLNAYIEETLKKSTGTSFMVFHPAWGYYASDHGLNELAVEYHSKDPTPRQMARLIKEARDKGIKVVFASPQFSTRSAEAIAREIDGRVEVVDPLAKNYVENLKKVTDVLAEYGL
jgi:zinc transport system substrate-binding protein